MAKGQHKSDVPVRSKVFQNGSTDNKVLNRRTLAR